MKFYKLEANPPIVGANGKFKFKHPGSDKEIFDFAEQKATEHIESYCDPVKEAEESGVEFEYDWNHEEITEKEYNELDYEEID